MQTYHQSLAQGVLQHPIIVINNPNSKTFDHHLQEIAAQKGQTLQELISWDEYRKKNPNPLSFPIYAAMSIGESKSTGYTVKDNEWVYDEEAAQPANVVIDQRLNAPKTAEEAMSIVRLEAQIRVSEDFLSKSQPWVEA